MQTPPHPGSEEAQALGCICPVIANCHGQGIRRGNGEIGFWMTAGCPVHNPKEEPSCQVAP